MALGGIPVSGGITGKATLISTNLLYSPLLYDAYGNPMATPVYTLGGDAGVTGYEAAFAIDRDPKTLYKSAPSTNDLTITMIHGATPPMVYGVVLLGHNIIAADVSLAKFEGGMDTNYNTVSEDLVINAAALTPAYHLLTTPVAHDHWRIRVNFASSTALQIGEIFLIGAPPLAFARNYNWGATRHIEKGKTTTEGIPGIRRVTTRWKRFYNEIVIDSASEAQWEALNLADTNSHVIFSPNGVNGPAYFGDINLEPADEFKSGQSITMKFIEASR